MTEPTAGSVGTSIAIAASKLGGAIIAGIEAHVCVTQTAMDLESQGFEAFVVADAVGSRSKASRKLALARMQKSGVDIVDLEMVLFEWMERAGTPEFKQLQALIK